MRGSQASCGLVLLEAGARQVRRSWYRGGPPSDAQLDLESGFVALKRSSTGGAIESPPRRMSVAFTIVRSHGQRCQARLKAASPPTAVLVG